MLQKYCYRILTLLHTRTVKSLSCIEMYIGLYLSVSRKKTWTSTSTRCNRLQGWGERRVTWESPREMAGYWRHEDRERFRHGGGVDENTNNLWLLVGRFVGTIADRVCRCPKSYQLKFGSSTFAFALSLQMSIWRQAFGCAAIWKPLFSAKQWVWTILMILFHLYPHKAPVTTPLQLPPAQSEFLFRVCNTAICQSMSLPVCNFWLRHHVVAESFVISFEISSFIVIPSVSFQILMTISFELTMRSLEYHFIYM